MKKVTNTLLVISTITACLTALASSLPGRAVQTETDCSGCESSGGSCNVKTKKAYYCDGSNNSCSGSTGSCAATGQTGTCTSGPGGIYTCEPN